MKDTFPLWAHQDKESGEITWTGAQRHSRGFVRYTLPNADTRVVKLECRIVPQKRKKGKYPNDNFGLPAGYTPHNPDHLTRDQIGKGFRLLAKGEIGSHKKFSLVIEAWIEASWDSTGWRGCLPHVTYRVPINTPLDINPELKTK